ncbi:MAG: hypothetical protein IIA75_06320 [Proteobacteria bacterium]|nr:hypothetical protein [Pseudomonadota bacterium]
MEMFNDAPTWLIIGVTILVAVWVILWFFLPFIVYAMNGHVRAIKTELIKINARAKVD